MIKSKLIELIRGHILGSNETVDRIYQADPRRLELDIAAAFNTTYIQIFKKSPSNLDRYVKVYKNVSVIQDPDTLTYYSLLPAKVIQYSTRGDGVWNINTMQGQDISFVPMDRNKNEIFYGSEWDSIDDVIKFSVINNRVEYYNFDPMITAVKMDLVVDFTEWAMTDDIPIPGGQDLNIINMVLQMNNIKPIDRLNNQNEVA